MNNSIKILLTDSNRGRHIVWIELRNGQKNKKKMLNTNNKSKYGSITA